MFILGLQKNSVIHAGLRAFDIFVCFQCNRFLVIAGGGGIHATLTGNVLPVRSLTCISCRDYTSGQSSIIGSYLCNTHSCYLKEPEKL